MIIRKYIKSYILKIKMIVFSTWILGLTIITLFSYMSLIGYDKIKKYVKSVKLLDVIEDKYDNTKILSLLNVLSLVKGKKWKKDSQFLLFFF